MISSKQSQNPWTAPVALLLLFVFSLLEFQVRFNEVLTRLNCTEVITDLEEEELNRDGDDVFLSLLFDIPSNLLWVQPAYLQVFRHGQFQRVDFEKLNACPRYIQFQQLRICALNA